MEVHQRPWRRHYCWLKRNQKLTTEGCHVTPPTDEPVVIHRLDKICSPAIQTAHVANPTENYCLLVTIQLQQSSDDTSAGVSVPAGALKDKIIRLYLSQVITDITQIVILNNTDFVIYRGRRSKDEGMSYDEVAHYTRNIVGSQDWVGFPVVIRATPLTLAESKVRIADARKFVHLLTMSKAQLESCADPGSPASRHRTGVSPMNGICKTIANPDNAGQKAE